MPQRNIRALVGVFALVLMPLTAVVADQTFHSQRLSFALMTFGALAGHPERRSGQVVIDSSCRAASPKTPGR